METISIDIVNPKAKKILKELAALNLIKIKENQPPKSFERLLKKLRRNEKSVLQEDILKEVELIRSKRYGKK